MTICKTTVSLSLSTGEQHVFLHARGITQQNFFYFFGSVTKADEALSQRNTTEIRHASFEFCEDWTYFTPALKKKTELNLCCSSVCVNSRMTHIKNLSMNYLCTKIVNGLFKLSWDNMSVFTFSHFPLTNTHPNTSVYQHLLESC